MVLAGGKKKVFGVFNRRIAKRIKIAMRSPYTRGFMV